MPVETSSDVEIPERSWADICSAARIIATKLFPDKIVALKVVSEQRIAGLNRDYRGIDAATDVLSFPPGAAEQRGHAGDIALCWRVVERQARQNGNSIEAEAVALFTHGLLHLAGFDHDTLEAAKLMDARTRQLSREAGYPVRAYGH
jgi:probable rRNA maturation factor